MTFNLSKSSYFQYTGYCMGIQKKKYQQVILYLCHRLGGEIRGKKKLAKLLYYADFDSFEKNQKSITGDTYKALPMGPFPVLLDKVSSEMKEARLLEIKSVRERPGYNPTEIYSCRGILNESIFSDEEKFILKRVVTNYGHLNGKQLEDLTHQEAPYVGTELSMEIPYELAFYRGTDFTES